MKSNWPPTGERTYQRNHQPRSAEKPPSRSRPRPWPSSPRSPRATAGGVERTGSRACRASPDPESPGRLAPQAECLTVRRRSRDCSEAAVPGADFCVISCGSEPARLLALGALSGPRVAPAAPRGYPGGEKTRGPGWVGRLQQVGFGLLDWRPGAPLSGASCSLTSWTCCL